MTDSFAGSRREAIFMVGEDDFIFRSQMKTIPTYQHWDWQTLLLTYPGNHEPTQPRSWRRP